MYVHHEVSSCGVLHDKTHMFWRLETCKQVDQEGVVRAVDGLKDPLLTHQTGDRQRGAEGGAYETVITVRGVIMRWMSFVARLRLEVEVSERRVCLPFHFIPRNDVSLLQGFDGVLAA